MRTSSFAFAGLKPPSSRCRAEPKQGLCRKTAWLSSDGPLHDFQASAAIENDFPVIQVGVKTARLELAQPHLAGNGAGAGHLPLLQIDRYVAGFEAVAVGTD